jgi:hypothetical protein
MLTRLFLNLIKSHTTNLPNRPRREICLGVIVVNGASLILSNLSRATECRVGATLVFFAKICIALDCACSLPEISATDVRAPSLRVVLLRQTYCVMKYGSIFRVQKPCALMQALVTVFITRAYAFE